MGAVVSKFWSWAFSSAECKVLILGLNNAGKTTILYKMLLGQVVSTAPTIGSNVEEYDYKNCHLIMWDLGGQEVLRDSWSTYYTNTDAVIFVVDSTDRDRMELVRGELVKMLQHPSLQRAVLLVYANKQDVKGSMSAADVSAALRLHAVDDHEWHIQSCCALTGAGINEGLDWIATKMQNK